jgi:bisphosphoglycerate-dependent phosphoglycerate mutase
VPLLRQGQNILMCAHGNTIRALYVYWKHHTPESIVTCEIPFAEVIEVDIDVG